jgi:hypothetical protein
MAAPAIPGFALDVIVILVDVPGIVDKIGLMFGVTVFAPTVTADPNDDAMSRVEFCPEQVGSKFTAYESGSNPMIVYVPLALVTANPLPMPPSEDVAETHTSLRPLGLKVSVTVPEIDPGNSNDASIAGVVLPEETVTCVAPLSMTELEYHWGTSGDVTVLLQVGSKNT